MSEYHDKYCEFGWNKGATYCNCVARKEDFDKRSEYRRGFHDGASAVGHKIKEQGLKHVFEVQRLRQNYKIKLHAETHKAFTKGWEKGQANMGKKPPEKNREESNEII